jgi:secreted trypsin-like serine protease
MKRTGADYLEYHEEEGFYGRVAIVKKVEFYTINNILNSIAVENNQESSSINFVKIGIQGPSGMLMCING